MSHTIKALASVAAQKQIHIQLGQQSEQLGLRIHEAACQDLLHCATHGDVTLCQDLFERLGGQKGSQARTTSLRDWFVKFSGNQITAEKGQWKMKKGWEAGKFDLDGAQSTPYYDKVEKTAKAMSWETIIGMLRRLPQQVETAFEKDAFNGDAMKVKAILDGLVDEAEERGRRLTMQERGKVLNMADAILKRNETVPAAITAAMSDDSGVAGDEVPAGDTVTEPTREAVNA